MFSYGIMLKMSDLLKMLLYGEIIFFFLMLVLFYSSLFFEELVCILCVLGEGE